MLTSSDPPATVSLAYPQHRQLQDQHTQPSGSSTTTRSASSSRTSRLRGLSYLRNYTQDRLLSSRSDAPPLTRTASSPNSTAALTFAASQIARPFAVITSSREGTNDNSSSGDHNGQTLPGMVMTSQHARTRAATTSATLAMNHNVTAAASSSSRPAQQTSDSGIDHQQKHPTIRFIPHVETRSSRPSLHFAAITKTLKQIDDVVRVGRYSDREQTAPRDGVLPVGFKSKVVSRRHCEFWCTNGQWFVKDVKSSSGTFLNHVRLSSPGVESRPYPVNDGDVVQLGIDFKGGEEIIFRCVKIRVECNRGWQKGLNNFNTQTHKKLLRSVAGTNKRDSDAASVSNHECSICLNPVTPCQCLFVAPCSHVWHYKCVRNLVHGPNWPNFLCPNCRFVADLEADIEPPEEDLYEQPDELQHEDEGVSGEVDQSGHSSGSSDEAIGGAGHDDQHRSQQEQQHVKSTSPREASSADAAASIPAEVHDDTLSIVDATAASSTTRPVPIASTSNKHTANSEAFSAASTTPNSNIQFANGVIADVMLTPRNDAGPFILDGAANREALDEIITQRVDEDER